MHDINNNNATANMSNIFQKTSDINSYNIRSSTFGKFYVKGSRLEIQCNSCSRLEVKLWNKMPYYNNESSKESFQMSSSQIAMSYIYEKWRMTLLKSP